MICQQCGQQHPSHFTYCPNTSKIINAEHQYSYNTSEYCANCSTINAKGFSYCVNCGHTYLTKSSKKKGIEKFVENTFSNIKIPSKVNVNTEDIKTASVKNFEYIKNNKLILVPIAISMVLVIVLTLILKSAIMAPIEDFLKDAGIPISDLSDYEDYYDDLEDEFGFNFEPPKVHFTPILMTFAHNINYSFEVSLDNLFVDGNGKLDLNNFFTGLLIIPVISLIIGGIVYGRMAIKNNWPLYKGIIYSTIAYLLFMIIVSFFGRVSYDEKAFVLNFTPSFFDLLFSTIVLTLLFFGGFAIISYFGKAVVDEMEKTSKYLLYGLSAFIITLVGLIINYLYSLVFLMNKLSEITEDLPSIGGGVITVYTSIITWFMSLFGNFYIGDEDNNFTYMLLFNNSKIDELLYELDFDGSLGFVFILMLIVIVIIGAVSYFLYEKHQLNIKDVVIFAAAFAVIQLLALYMSNVSIKGIADGDSVKFVLGFNVIATVITSFIVSGASFYGGGYLRKMLKK